VTRPREAPAAPLIDGIRILVRLSRVVQSECEQTGLTLPQYRALLTVSHSSRRASELADFAAVSRPAVTALVNGLVNQGLLLRKPVPGDGRGVHLVATAKGRRAVKRAESRMAERLEEIVGEHARILELLPVLESGLDEDLVRDVIGRNAAGASPEAAKPVKAAGARARKSARRRGAAR
jgi:DNA-binding MarR family transcriptional regulator